MNKTLCILFGVMIGVMLGGFTTLHKAYKAAQQFKTVVSNFVNVIDDDYFMDVLVETDEWSELNYYLKSAE